MKARFDSSGRCNLCMGGWLCEPCQQDGLERDKRKMEAIRFSNNLSKEMEIGMICSRHELESDEFQTREQKAERYLRNY